MKSGLTVKEVASLLRVSEKQIYALSSAGKLVSYRVGKLIRFDEDAIRRYCSPRTGMQQEKSQTS